MRSWTYSCAGPLLTEVAVSAANLGGANLIDARGVTEEQLEEQAQTLEGATMPDGSEHP